MATVHTCVEGPRGCGFRKGGGIYLVSGQLSEPCPLLPYETQVCPTCGEGIRPARGFTWVDGAKFIPPTEHATHEHSNVCPLGPKLVRDLSDDELTERDLPEDAKPTDALIEPDGGLVSRIGRCGLIWIGEMHYPTPQSFMEEAARMGVSRRITAVPRGFEVGETWVLLGHRKAVEKACSDCGDLPERVGNFALTAAEAGETVKVELGGTRGPDSDCPVCNSTGYEHRPGVITAFKPTAVEYVVTGEESEEELDAMEARGLTLVKVERADQEALV